MYICTRIYVCVVTVIRNTYKQSTYARAYEHIVSFFITHPAGEGGAAL